jgi:multiple sugar transport system permease protein
MEIVKSRVCYVFLAPYAIVFALFYIAPLVVSVFYSFTYFNILEPPKFIGLRNYINLMLGDDVFLKALKNTFIMAAITGPIGYLFSFLFAWFINELPRYIRAVVTLVFYAPSISGAVYMIWAIIFSGDAYGYINGLLLNLGILDQPVLWLTDPRYMMPVMLIVILWMSLGTGFLAFIAGLSTIDVSLYEAGLVDGIKNRWQELWYITLPNMKGMLMFGAVMAITQSFGVADVTVALAGFPSTDYAVHTVVNHLVDYGSLRFEMGYASAIATLLFLTMIICNTLVQKLLRRVGT